MKLFNADFIETSYPNCIVAFSLDGIGTLGTTLILRAEASTWLFGMTKSRASMKKEKTVSFGSQLAMLYYNIITSIFERARNLYRHSFKAKGVKRPKTMWSCFFCFTFFHIDSELMIFIGVVFRDQTYFNLVPITGYTSSNGYNRIRLFS